MGSKTLANAFRTLEIEIAEKGLTGNIKTEVLLQIGKLDSLIAFMENIDYANAG